MQKAKFEQNLADLNKSVNAAAKNGCGCLLTLIVLIFVVLVLSAL